MLDLASLYTLITNTNRTNNYRTYNNFKYVKINANDCFILHNKKPEKCKIMLVLHSSK